MNTNNFFCLRNIQLRWQQIIITTFLTANCWKMHSHVVEFLSAVFARLNVTFYLERYRALRAFSNTCMENKVVVSKNGRSKWPARPEFDRSSPRSGQTLSVDRPLFAALLGKFHNTDIRCFITFYIIIVSELCDFHDLYTFTLCNVCYVF